MNKTSTPPASKFEEKAKLGSSGVAASEFETDRLRSELSEANQRIAELESLARQQDSRIDELMTDEALAQARIAELETENHNEPERIASVASGCIPADTFIRLRDWLSSESREAAYKAFTAGIERQLAYVIECSGILEQGERYFLDQDQDCHWYIIPVSHRTEWLNWNSQDRENEAYWTPPDFAKSLGGSHTHTLVTFENPEIA